MRNRPICGVSRADEEANPIRQGARYAIVEPECTEEVLVIRDIGPWERYLTVTNDAEAVVDQLFRIGRLRMGMRLWYYDSAGMLDEIVFNEPGRISFRPVRKDGLCGS